MLVGSPKTTPAGPQVSGRTPTYPCFREMLPSTRGVTVKPIIEPVSRSQASRVIDIRPFRNVAARRKHEFVGNDRVERFLKAVSCHRVVWIDANAGLLDQLANGAEHTHLTRCRRDPLDQARKVFLDAFTVRIVCENAAARAAFTADRTDGGPGFETRADDDAAPTLNLTQQNCALKDPIVSVATRTTFIRVPLKIKPAVASNGRGWCRHHTRIDLVGQP